MQTTIPYQPILIAFFPKKRTIDGVHKALWINPRRGVSSTYFDKWVIRQIREYQQLQEGKLLPSVDLIDCDTISISQEYQSDCGLASADPPSMFTGTNGILCDMKCVESYESAKVCLISPEMYYYPLYCLVWATKLLLAAIGLVFPELVLGYKSFNCSMYHVSVPTLIERFV
jgi:hypothetical protein